MEFWLTFLCIIATPIIIFLIGPEARGIKRAFRLLFPIGLYLLFSTLGMAFQECFPLSENGCLIYKAIWLSIINLLYVMGVGWCEILWRQYYQLPSWPLRENKQHGWTSNIVLAVSASMTLFLAMLMIHNFINLLR